ncbi:hypothetical protein [Legionella qingyii]|nr:hypothetical protein [Legionella qingyii]
MGMILNELEISIRMIPALAGIAVLSTGMSGIANLLVVVINTPLEKRK